MLQAVQSTGMPLPPQARAADAGKPESATAAPAPVAARTGFAVVVTSYNYRDFVVAAVDSALAQNRAPAQVIVVDDGSTDGSAELLRERYAHDGRVTLVCAENGGQLAAFQRGMTQVTADVTCFLDSDDCWDAGYLERLGELYDARADIDFVFSDLRHFGNDSRVESFHRAPVDLGFTAVSTWQLTVWYGAQSSALSLRTPCARRVLDLPEAFRATWRTSPDNCLVYGASILGARKYFLPTGCVNYRIHGNNAWLSHRSPTQSYRNLWHTRELIAHYARVAGMDASCTSIEMCKLEYRTKPQPPWFETTRYARLVMMQRVWPPWRKWERALSILAHGLGVR